MDALRDFTLHVHWLRFKMDALLIQAQISVAISISCLEMALTSGAYSTPDLLIYSTAQRKKCDELRGRLILRLYFMTTFLNIKQKTRPKILGVYNYRVYHATGNCVHNIFVSRKTKAVLR
jgi:hypothetical protein